MEFSLRESKILQMGGGNKKEAFNFLGRTDVTLITGGPYYLALRDNHTPARGIMGLMKPKRTKAARAVDCEAVEARAALVPKGFIKPIIPRVGCDYLIIT